jgi:hypothetical protein
MDRVENRSREGTWGGRVAVWWRRNSGQLQNSQFVIVGNKSTIGFRVFSPFAIAYPKRAMRYIYAWRWGFFFLLLLLLLFVHTYTFIFLRNVQKASGSLDLWEEEKGCVQRRQRGELD